MKLDKLYFLPALYLRIICVLFFFYKTNSKKLFYRSENIILVYLLYFNNFI